MELLAAIAGALVLWLLVFTATRAALRTHAVWTAEGHLQRVVEARAARAAAAELD